MTSLWSCFGIEANASQVTGVVVLPVPWADVQCMILVPWEGIVLWAILAPLVCHYGAVVGKCLSLQPLP